MPAYNISKRPVSYIAMRSRGIAKLTNHQLNTKCQVCLKVVNLKRVYNKGFADRKAPNADQTGVTSWAHLALSAYLVPIQNWVVEEGEAEQRNAGFVLP